MAWLILAGIISVIPVANLIVPLMGVNFYTCVRNYRESGQKMSFGDLFDFSDALDKIIGPIVVGVLIGIGYICLIIPGIILTFMWAFTPCIQGDRVELSFIQAMKESKRLAKGNYIQNLFLSNHPSTSCLFRFFASWRWGVGYFTCRSCRTVLCLRSMQEVHKFLIH